MRSYLINKNLCFYYWLRKRIGKNHALLVANNIEKTILIFGREVMSMKRFLMLFILVVFMTVSCAGPNKAGWTKPDFRQDQFDKDHEDCIQTVKDDPKQKMTVEECLTKKGYEYEPEPSSDKGKPKTNETAKNVGKVSLVIGLVAFYVAIVVAATVAMALIGL